MLKLEVLQLVDLLKLVDIAAGRFVKARGIAAGRFVKACGYCSSYTTNLLRSIQRTNSCTG